MHNRYFILTSRFGFAVIEYLLRLTSCIVTQQNSREKPTFKNCKKVFPTANFSFQDLGILRAYGAAKPSSPMLIKYYQVYSFNFGEKFSYQTQKKAQQQTCRDLIIFADFFLSSDRYFVSTEPNVFGTDPTVSFNSLPTTTQLQKEVQRLRIPSSVANAEERYLPLDVFYCAA